MQPHEVDLAVLLPLILLTPDHEMVVLEAKTGNPEKQPDRRRQRKEARKD